MANTTLTYGANTSLTVTGLANLASSATVGWQSDRIDNTSTKALDYLIECTFPMASTAAANDKSIYVFACPAYYDGGTWYHADGGTTTLPSGTNGSYTLSTTLNNFTLVKSLNYVATGQTVQGTMSLSQAFGSTMPHGFSIIILNYTGAAMAASGAKIQVTPITYSTL